ncbi:HD-GYP domain, c-di-GMP phosphodiesterase class II (or its inactivated variant) [Anaerocolumna jejuensis DSM 15929]|uniref:HD-GYP domain, c-di-GMP phosphodiesterase class II (Or its inactivated variant) n=1 Tax=Anaerocolumna jejuensis DSM 15929 TaxID=1121322 RepID=A0A1M6RMN6_9FIRM|nr:HD domain-containing phosphohydrolase [Anaerocolumna jejuensis]SHK33598.1 HD-GYP domain, c-di-GMP phosphodiesterase class II (or its inactivated variant) [Anaerocolumna jejuensis DSM 15929]
MRKVLLDSIKGHELLARDVVSDSGIVIMTAGSPVKIEYARKLKELGYSYICVEDELSRGINEEENLEEKIKEECQDIVRDIIERYTYQGYGELEEIKNIAENIICDIVNSPNVLYSISGIRKKSESTYSHSLNVCAMSVLIALRMKLPKEKVRQIAIGSLLHDMGYNLVKIDYQDFNYLNGSKEEQKELMKHVVYGYSSVIKESWLPVASKDIILCHHERNDGTGFPFHKKGDKIKIGSKIVAVCDTFDSLTYGFMMPKLKVHHALDYILSQASIKFDFDVVNCFIELVAAYPNGTIVITNEGEKGIVLRQNTKCPTRPVLRMLTDADGNDFVNWIEKDLKVELSVMIVDALDTEEYY